MNNALIGYTGFVGSSLLKQTDTFNELYNSKNISEIEGKEFDTVLCAGAPGVKWLANKNPDQDLESIIKLMTSLKKVKSNFFVLISTVDVYPNPINVTEDSKIDTSKLSPYGFNRLLLEEFVANTFENHLIIRLPGLVGTGLRKNIIFDLLNYNNIDKINGSNIFQFYPMNNLYEDILFFKCLGNKLINMSTSQISAYEIGKLFGVDLPMNGKEVEYNMKTKYNFVPWYSKEEMIMYINEYIQNEPINI